RDVAEERSERHDELHAERLGELDDVLAERAPAHRRLDAAHEHEIARRARRERLENLDARPRDLTLAGLGEANARAARLVVEEILGVDARETARVERARQEGDSGRGGLAGVVPALER